MTQKKKSILDFLKSEYKGSYRFLKDKMFIKKFGSSLYKEICDYTKFLDNTDYSFSVRVRSYIEDINEQPKCIVCGKETIFNSNNGWQATCSRNCHMKSPDRIKKMFETNLKKYGTVNYFASNIGKQKVIESNIKKYGVDNYAKTEEYKNRIKTGNIETNRNPYLTSETHRLNYYNSLINGDMVMPLFSFEEYEGFKNWDKEYNWKCKKCGLEYSSVLRNHKHLKCRVCKKTGTKMEVAIKQFLDNQKIPYIYRERNILDGYEIDVYVSSHKLGIELNGLYWHSEEHKDKELHKIKADLAEEKGIKLIQIFEDEFNDKNDIVMSRIKNLLQLNDIKIFARKCIIKEIDNKIKKEFLELNHIQGNSNTSINFGLFYNNELMSVMTFSKERLALGNNKTNEGVYELNRFCSKIGVNIIGSANKLLRHFIKKYKPNKIISYADRRWSNGNIYEILGFDFKGNTKCNYWYTRDFRLREHRFKYRKDVLSKRLLEYDENLTEKENMEINGYSRIWDAGSKKYEMLVKN